MVFQPVISKHAWLQVIWWDDGDDGGVLRRGRDAGQRGTENLGVDAGMMEI